MMKKKKKQTTCVVVNVESHIHCDKDTHDKLYEMCV